jgi:hypothetical protein
MRKVAVTFSNAQRMELYFTCNTKALVAAVYYSVTGYLLSQLGCNLALTHNRRKYD